VKTATYLRFSLLLPFLVWGVCHLFLIAVTASPIDELMSGESTTIPGILYLFFAFYVLGIVLWFFPYLLLSLILLALSNDTRVCSFTNRNDGIYDGADVHIAMELFRE
jgi:hypothetical protein